MTILIKHTLLIILALLPFHQTLADWPTQEEEIKYRHSEDGLLMLYSGSCLLVKESILEGMNEEWQTAAITPADDINRCEGPTWKVKKNRSYQDRPTMFLIDGELIDSGQRVNVGAECSGPSVKVTRAGYWMPVGTHENKTLYALCVTE